VGKFFMMHLEGSLITFISMTLGWSKVFQIRQRWWR